MPRKPSPWYWEKRNLWCVTIQKQRHVLGEHPDGVSKPAKNKQGLWNVPKEIDDVFHKLMSREPHTPATLSNDSVAAILDDFLTWTYENRAKRTADRYKDFVQDFVCEYGLSPICDLTTAHVTAWLSQKTTWGPTTKHNAITALQRGFNWAVRNRGLRYNPIKGMEKPKANTRTTVVTPDEFEDLIGHFPEGDPFRDLLIVSYDSGARPQEVKQLEARHLQLDKKRAVIPAEEAKKGIQRAFYFPTVRSLEIVTRLAQDHPTGPIFLNTKGNPWTGFAVKCRFENLEDKIGRRLHQYALRHSRITDWLLSGVDSHTVAKLAGHQNTAMLDKTYSHVADDYKYMLNAAQMSTNANSEVSDDEQD